MANKLTDYSRVKLPDGRLDAPLKGAEDDIRQEGVIIALDWLAKHLGAGEPVTTWDYRHSLAISLRFARRRHLSRLERSAKTVSIDDTTGGSCDHPSQQDLINWPAERMRKMAACAISAARRDGSISVTNAQVASLIYVHGLTAEEAAIRRGVTRGAIYQQLGRVQRVIKPVIDRIEAPFEM